MLTAGQAMLIKLCISVKQRLPYFQDMSSVIGKTGALDVGNSSQIPKNWRVPSLPGLDGSIDTPTEPARIVR